MAPKIQSPLLEAAELEALEYAARRAMAYLNEVRSRPVAPSPLAVRDLEQLGGALPASGSDPIQEHYQSIGIRFTSRAMRSMAARLVSTSSLVVAHDETLMRLL